MHPPQEFPAWPKSVGEVYPPDCTAASGERAGLLHPVSVVRRLDRINRLKRTPRNLTTAVDALRGRTEQLLAIEHVEASRCEPMTSVPCRANTVPVFLNSHAASIPADAAPVTLERSRYQIRLGPPTRAMHDLIACMPADR